LKEIGQARLKLLNLVGLGCFDSYKISDTSEDPEYFLACVPDRDTVAISASPILISVGV
jgi:hypothetical protein